MPIRLSQSHVQHFHFQGLVAVLLGKFRKENKDESGTEGECTQLTNCELDSASSNLSFT